MDKPHILIIEDEPGIADNIVYALQADGFSCTHAPVAAEGAGCIGSAKC